MYQKYCLPARISEIDAAGDLYEKGLSIMENLMNGAFYNFLISQCTISFEHNPAIFDWIPVLERIHLAKLLDSWLAAAELLEWYLGHGCPPDIIHTYTKTVAERWQLFDLTLKMNYHEAEILFEVGERSGVNELEVDWEFWRQVYGHRIKELHQYGYRLCL